jgi:hypothetical protein
MQTSKTIIREDPRTTHTIVKYQYRPEKARSSWVVEQYQMTAITLSGIAMIGRVGDKSLDRGSV